MKAETGLGIAGIVLAVIGALVPFVGLYIGWFALIIVAVAAYMGERGLTIATMVISALVFLFLTPSLWVSAAGGAIGATASSGAAVAGGFLVIGTVICFLLPIAGMIFGKGAEVKP